MHSANTLFTYSSRFCQSFPVALARQPSQNSKRAHMTLGCQLAVLHGPIEGRNKFLLKQGGGVDAMQI